MTMISMDINSRNCARPVLKPMSEFLNEPAMHCDWVLEGLLIEGGTSLMVGKPKSGKSTVTRQLARCVSRGELCLGRNTKRGRVLLFALEDHPDRLRDQLLQLGVTEEDDIHVHASVAPPNAVEWLIEQVRLQRPALVVVDPLLKLVRVRDGNDYVEMTKQLEPLTAIARETGAHIVCSHHQKKNDQDEFDSVLGSTAITGAVDSVMLLKREERTGVRTLKTRQRYGDDLEPTILDFDSATGCIGVGPTIARKRSDVLIAAVAHALLVNGSLDETEIRKHVGGDGGKVGRAIRTGVDRGMFIRVRTGKKGDAYLYSLTNPEMLLAS